MTKFRKLLALMLVFVGAITLVGCKPDVEGPTDLEQLAEALTELELASETSSDLTLPGTGLHDVVITWSSSNTDVIAIDGTVTIPTFTEGDKTVTITASLALGDDTLTKTFEVTVLAADETDAEKLADAKAQLLLAHPDQLVVDLVLPATSGDATVTWATSDATVITAAGVIARPTFGDGNATATLTATLTVGTLTDTKDFPLTIKEDDPENMFDTVAEMHTASTVGDIVEFEGIVTSIFDGGYVLTDGTHGLMVMNAWVTLKPDVQFGDLVYVKGEYANYHSMYQITDPTIQIIKETGGTVPISPTVMTIAEVLALDSTTQAVHSLRYTVTGFITEGYDNYGDEALFIVDGDDSLLIYGYLLDDSQDALEDAVGTKVTMTVAYYVDHTTKGVTVIFDGGAADLVLAVLTETEKFDADVNAVGDEIEGATLTTITLPTVGTNGTTFASWTSDMPLVIGNDGVFVDVAATTVTVTFTATATNGDTTGTATITVVVPVLSTIEEVLAMDLGSYFEVTGVVYEESKYGFYIHQDGHYLFIKDDSFIDDIAPGDTITVLGKSGIYKGLLQVSVLTKVIEDTDLALVDAIVLSIGALENDLVQRGTIATITGTLEERVDGSYTDLFIVGPAGSEVKIYHSSNADELENNIGDIVTIDVVTYQNGLVLYQGLEADITVETAFTDLQTAQDIADMIVIEDADEIIMDIDLPLTNTAPVATMVWASNLPLIVAADGTVNAIVGDTLVTLTVTVTVNSVDATRDIVVNVIDANESTPLSVADALAATVGDSLLVTGVVNGFYYEQIYIQDADGTAIYVDSELSDLVEIGDKIVIRAERDYYDANGNTRAELTNATLVGAIVSSGNTLVTFDDVTLTMIAADYNSYIGKIIVFTDLTVTDYEYDLKTSYMEFLDGTTSFVLSRYAIPYTNDLWTDGEVISEITVLVHDVYYSGLRFLVQEYPAPPAAYALTDAEGRLSIPTTVAANMELPALSDRYDVDVTWATSDAAVITAAGVVTRPAIGEANATVTLTATLSIGTETPVTKDFVVTVTATPDPTAPVTEDLTNFDGVTNTYTDGTFTGVNGIVWNYHYARRFTDDSTYTIGGTGTSIMFKDSGTRDLTATITGGIGTFSIDLRSGYTGGAAADRTVEIYVNDVLKGTYTLNAMGVVENFEITDINITGEFTLKIVSTGVKQLIIDNITWSPYTG